MFMIIIQKNIIPKFLFVFQALIIALTSDFIPKLVWMFYESEDATLEGYVEATISGKAC